MHRLAPAYVSPAGRRDGRWGDARRSWHGVATAFIPRLHEAVGCMLTCKDREEVAPGTMGTLRRTRQAAARAGGGKEGDRQAGRQAASAHLQQGRADFTRHTCRSLPAPEFYCLSHKLSPIALALYLGSPIALLGLALLALALLPRPLGLQMVKHVTGFSAPQRTQALGCVGLAAVPVVLMPYCPCMHALPRTSCIPSNKTCPHQPAARSSPRVTRR
jgi:hypothetical protein